MAQAVKDRDLGWKRIKKTLRELGGVRVGVQGAEAGVMRDGITQAGLATVHEFGSSAARIPQRSFLRSTFDKNRKAYTKELRTVGNLAISGRRKIPKGLEDLGKRYRQDVDNKLLSGIAPPLKERTIVERKRKGFAAGPPLVRSGQLAKAITVKVE